MRLFRRPPAMPGRPTHRSGRESRPESQPVNELLDESLRVPLSSRLDDNLKRLEDVILDSDDVLVRDLTIGPKQNIAAAVIYIEGFASRTELEDSLLQSILIGLHQIDVTQPSRGWLQLLRDAGVVTAAVGEVRQLADAVEAVLRGQALLLLDGFDTALTVNVQDGPTRSVQESPAERVIRGSRAAFTEALNTNTALLRRSVANPNLKIRVAPMGRRTGTYVAVAYIAGLANPDLLGEVRSRLDSLDADRYLGAGQLEQYLVDSWFSPFPQTESTERVDRTAMALADGRVAILISGTPFVLLIPTTFNSMMLSPEDYNQNWIVASLVRMLRVLSTFLSLTLPPLYIALSSFHPEMLPTPMLISIGTVRLRTPFPAIVEAFSMEVALEILREAGVRLPAPLGQTVGVVGGIVIGDAAIRAGLIGPTLLIVVALTTIASYSIPNYDLASAIRILRFPLMLAASVFGLFGLAAGLIAIGIHLTVLKSFGTYYLSPIAPQRFQEMKDSLVRFPYASLHLRPKSFAPLDRVRMSDKRQEVVGPRGKGKGR